MKIALIHHQYIPKGGMEQYLADLIKGFSEAGDSVYLITSKLDPTAPNLERCTVVKNNVSFIPKPLRKCFFSGRLARLIDDGDYDLSLSVTRSTKQDIIVCGGTHRGFLKYMGQKPGLLDRLEISLEENGYRHSRLVMAHSEMLREEIVSLYNIPPEKVFVLHPPCDSARFNQSFRTDRERLKLAYGLKPNRKSLLFPSTGHSRKGLDLLAGAMDMMKKDTFELLIAGSRPDQGYDIKNTRYLGFIRNMEELYTAVDFTVLPSRYEPFGLAAIESVLCGTPVIISKVFGARDILTDAESVLIESLTHEGVAAAIEEACGRQFNISPEFAVENKLKLHDHIKSIKKIAGF